MVTPDTDRWMEPFLLLLRTHARLFDDIESDVRQISGLSVARYDVLAHLDMAGGSLRLTALADAIVLSPSGLSKLLDRMERSALIERRPDPDDARSTFASITPHGRATIRRTQKLHHIYLQGRFGDALDDTDLADLARIMNKLDRALSGRS
jgi:DNA-binding MarR family transcriptional regulator